MQYTHNTLSENIRAKSVELLNKHLAAAIDLHGQVKQAHWNVRGPGFIAVHELFDKVADAVEDYSDTLAERAAALGGTAHGTVQVAAERSFLVPYALGIAEKKKSTSSPFRQRWRPSANPRGKRSPRPLLMAMPTRPTCSPRSRAASIISFGSSSRT